MGCLLVASQVMDKVMEIVNAPDSLRKRLALRMLENHAEAHLKDDPNTPKDSAGAIDWASVDWATVLTTLLKIFVAILPLLLV